MSTPASAATQQQQVFDPRSQSYSETHASLFVVRLSLAQGESGKTPTNTAISYWDSISGGTMSRNVTKRMRPGQPMAAKIPGLHIDVGQITLSRAWNRRLEHREPVETMLGVWLGAVRDGLIADIRMRVTQMYLDNDTGRFVDYDFYEGPVVSYEGPKSNSEGDDLAKETLVIDPERYGKLEVSAPAVGASNNPSGGDGTTAAAASPTDINV